MFWNFKLFSMVNCERASLLNFKRVFPWIKMKENFCAVAWIMWLELWQERKLLHFIYLPAHYLPICIKKNQSLELIRCAHFDFSLW